MSWPLPCSFPPPLSSLWFIYTALWKRQRQKQKLTTWLYMLQVGASEGPVWPCSRSSGQNCFLEKVSKLSSEGQVEICQIEGLRLGVKRVLKAQRCQGWGRSLLPNSVLFILLPTSNLALPKRLLHAAANLLSEVQLWSCHHANNSTKCPFCPQYGVEILVEQTRHSSPDCLPFSSLLWRSCSSRGPSSLIFVVSVPWIPFLPPTLALYLADFYFSFRVQFRHSLCGAYLPP